MTDREKLFDLIVDAENKLFKESPHYEDRLRIDRVAGYLLAHGVTVKEPQKPIKRGYLLENSPCWLEEVYENGLYALEIVEITKGTGPNYYSYSIGSENADLHNGQLYGKTWRCWAEKPTEEERKAAEWE